MRGTPITSARNQFQERWEQTVEQAKELFGCLTDDRSRMLLLNGPPASRLEARCSSIIWPVEVWYYAGSERIHSEFLVVFYRHWGAGPLPDLECRRRVWARSSPAAPRTPAAATSLQAIANGCRDGDKIAGAIGYVVQPGDGVQPARGAHDGEAGRAGRRVGLLLQRLLDRPRRRGRRRCRPSSRFDFPGRYQNRTVMEGLVSVPTAGAGQSSLGGAHTYDLLLNGELLQNGQLFDSFRYKFDFPRRRRRQCRRLRCRWSSSASCGRATTR